MDLHALAGRVHDHLENDEVEKAVMASLRLARAASDHLNAANFVRELYPERSEVARVLHDDLAHLKSEAVEFVWRRSAENWIELHTIEDMAADQKHLPAGERRNVLKLAVGEIEGELAHWNRVLAEAPPTGLTPMDAAAFAVAHQQQSADIFQRVRAIQIIKSRLKTRCLNYAIQMERQLGMQRSTDTLLWTVQNEVHNYFKERSEDIYRKLQKAAQLASSSDAEDASLLLTEVRRILKAVADLLYPASPDRVVCSDGKERTMGDEQYMNRLEQLLSTQVHRSSARELAMAELRLLAAFTRRLNDMASKGVHADVAPSEARQGLVGLYMLLFNLTQLLTVKAADEIVA